MIYRTSLPDYIKPLLQLSVFNAIVVLIALGVGIFSSYLQTKILVALFVVTVIVLLFGRVFPRRCRICGELSERKNLGWHYEIKRNAIFNEPKGFLAHYDCVVRNNNTASE